MKKRILLFVLAVVTLAACAPSGGGGTGGGGGGTVDVCNLSGTIDTQVTLSPTTCSTYNVVDDLTVGDTGKLIIEPGTVLEFAQDAALTVSGHGALVAVGTASDKILFTGASKVRGYWNGIIFNRANSFDNELKYVVVEYAGSERRWNTGSFGYYRTAIEVEPSSRLKMTYSLVRESLGSGIFIDTESYIGPDDVADGDFAHNTITANASYPVITYAKLVGFLDSSNDFTGNDAGYDFVRFSGSFEDIDTQTWQRLNVPYLVFREATVADGETLTIAPGVKLVFEQDAGITVHGAAAAIYAVGTPSEPIVFTGAQPVRGYWLGLNFDDSDSPNNVLRNVVVEYGGSNHGSGDEYGNVVVSSGGNASHQRIIIEDSVIRHSAHWGISVAQETAYTISNITYSDNVDGDFHLRP